jgi:hypothetical protein
MSSIVLHPDELLHIHLPDFEVFAYSYSEISSVLLDCSAAVNQRYIARGGISRLSLILE